MTIIKLDKGKNIKPMCRQIMRSISEEQTMLLTSNVLTWRIHLCLISIIQENSIAQIARKSTWKLSAESDIEEVHIQLTISTKISKKILKEELEEWLSSGNTWVTSIEIKPDWLMIKETNWWKNLNIKTLRIQKIEAQNLIFMKIIKSHTRIWWNSSVEISSYSSLKIKMHQNHAKEFHQSRLSLKISFKTNW